ncbi:MAG TPA: hypothetical protein VMT06_02470 [Candidatus Eisenbacteria bacterium]|nr:hypothetical protein [Candidatus Eisenbacteria bacterium]
MISDLQNKIVCVESTVGSLQSRLVTVRGQGYAAMGHLEKGIDLVVKKWADAGPMVKQTYYSNLQPLTSQITLLENEARNLRTQANIGNIGLNESVLLRLAAESSSLRARISSEAAKVSSPVNQLSASVNAIDRDMRVAETSLKLFSQAAFPLKPDESPVLAIEGKIMSGQKSEGTLYFTNRRFIFEVKKEMILEKKLFIATKKKIERTVAIDQPIGALQEISKGRVGLLAWTGIYARFKSGTGMQETPFDVKGWEADVITRFYSYITGGEADRDISQIKGTPVQTNESIQIVRCPSCGGPYSREVFRGQTAVQCEYCGTQIVIH